MEDQADNGRKLFENGHYFIPFTLSRRTPATTHYTVKELIAMLVESSAKRDAEDAESSLPDAPETNDAIDLTASSTIFDSDGDTPVTGTGDPYINTQAGRPDDLEQLISGEFHIATEVDGDTLVTGMADSFTSTQAGRPDEFEQVTSGEPHIVTEGDGDRPVTGTGDSYINTQAGWPDEFEQLTSGEPHIGTDGDSDTPVKESIVIL